MAQQTKIEKIPDIITLETYQDMIEVTDKSPQNILDNPILYYAIGIAGEAGELLEVFKKQKRNPCPPKGQTWESMFLKELGDVAWYSVRLQRSIMPNQQAQTGIIESNVMTVNSIDFMTKDPKEERFAHALIQAKNVYKTADLTFDLTLNYQFNMAGLMARQVLFHALEVGDIMGFSESDILRANLVKLYSRLQRGVLLSKGDDR